MVNADRTHDPPIELSVGARHDRKCSAILGLEEHVTKRAPPTGRRAGGVLFGIEGLVELLPKAAAQAGQVGVAERVDDERTSTSV